MRCEVREKTYETPCGAIHYWTNERAGAPASLVFLPGLTADHRLFDRQICCFEAKYRVLVWDAPAHAASWPFDFSFTLRDQARYARISGHGFRMLAEAMEADLPYELRCPALLICGERDRAGSCVRYNRAWHRRTGIPIRWIKGAGHNANTDAPEEVNRLIEAFVSGLSRG